ncbi:hypothetical protein LPJ64_006270 [Coemansia asiatica]|uniref:BZIP domain-containing protein n=1 Tax=Coemansia asiatica TaxID=1052880 RepID=A0A9W7XCU2_9FUNG|nr:hypothetical protein LPJ64_006270 [Coemansia asiatica]
MSLSRLPQVALRRLMPAISAVPKSLDDDQLKKILEPQQQQQSATKHTLPSKTDLSTLTSTQGLVSILTKLSSAPSSVPGTMTPALSRLLLNLSGNQGVLSSQDLALLKAASHENADGSLASTPEPGSPVMDQMLLTADGEPRAGALDVASVEALALALRETTTDCIDTSVAADQQSPGNRRPGRRSSPASVLMEHNDIASELNDHSDGELPPISNDLSAAERRREQNRRAQKKFRQKDKVRQKEVKWRAAQYEDLVETNKRFKKDIDSISRERDMYKRILELNGINIDEELKIGMNGGSTTNKAMVKSNTLETLRDAVVAAKDSLVGGDETRAASMASSVTANNSPMALSPAASMPASVLLAPSMDQIAQDTFGPMPGLTLAQQQQQQQQQPAVVSMQDLISSMLFGNGVKQDPMFGAASQSPSSLLPSMSTTTTAASETLPEQQQQQQNLWFDVTPTTTVAVSSSISGVSADPLLVESPLIIDQHQMDAQFGAQQHQTMIDSHMVDPMAFIDELLASPNFTAPSPTISFAQPTTTTTNLFTETRIRKRSFEDTL